MDNDRNDDAAPRRSSAARGSSRGISRPRFERNDEPEWTPRFADHPKAPAIPDEITEKDVAVPIRVALKTLSLENANRVARHLAMVSYLIDQDPQLAFEHAQAAAARAGRIAVVRETLGIAAYRIEEFALALRELTTYRRLSGLNDQLPIMVDCERGLGRPERALELGRSVDRSTLEPEVRVNLAIALSGARLDRGENDLALAELEIAELDASKVFDFSAPLFFAYGDTLEILGRETEAKKWWKLGDRAVDAFALKLEGDSEVVQVLEEIVIPAETTPTPKKESRDGERGFRDGDRGARDAGRGGDRGGRGGDRFGGRDAGRGNDRGSRSGDRFGSRDGNRRRDDRDGRGDDRPTRDDSRGARDQGDSSAPKAPWKKPEA